MGSYEQDSLAWQLRQLQQRFGEWWELQTSQFVSDISQASLPSWLSSTIWRYIAQTLFWITLALLLIWATLQVMRRLSPYLNTLKNQQSQSAKIRDNTGFRELSTAAWLAKAQKLQRQGNYRQACNCLYMAMLQRLNDKGVISHQASRTDGEYLQLIEQLPQPRPYQILLSNHQRLCFSNTEASPSVFDECQQAYQEIEDER
ncbi:MAG: DUF4129 domain-containing protein [Coleofasciculaceae cyanobacterium]